MQFLMKTLAIAALVSLSASMPAPATTAAPSLADRQDSKAKVRDAGVFTVKVRNALPVPVSTAHILGNDEQGVARPAPIVNGIGSGVLAPGAEDYYVLPQGWSGTLPIVAQDNYLNAIVGDESKIEASYTYDSGKFVFDLNVSYVDGFSVPISCECEGQGVMAGCNSNLWGMTGCPEYNGAGSCRNPMRNNGWSSTEFFAPCQHASYAYANDDTANTGNGVCVEENVISCCIGTDCPRNPRQA